MTDRSITQSAEAERQIIRGQVIALFVLVIMAYLSLFIDAYGESSQPFTPIELAIIVGLGVVYTLLVLSQGVVFDNFPTQIAPFVYFALIYGIILILLIMTDFGGQMWLLILPPLGAAAEVGNRWLLAICLLSFAVVIYSIYLVTGEFLLYVSLFVTPAIVFVAAFSWVTVRERETRERIEVLATELSDANKRLAEYADQVEQLTIVRERNRMAREIHDSLGHYLTVVNVQIGAAKAVMSAAPDKALDALEKAQKLTQEGLNEVRQSVGMLREGQEDKPLSETLPGLIEIAETAGIEIDYQAPDAWPTLPINVSRALYRTIQEGLTNMRKHADATAGKVIVTHQTENNAMHIEISDNGRGSADPQGGFGLVGMRERVQLLGGKLEVDTAEAAGFALYVELPIDRPEGPMTDKISVLLVDDQSLFREGLSTLLSVFDNIDVVGEAGNGREGVDLVGRLAPQVVLMDLRMPILDGVGATKEITARFPASKVIVLTTFDDDEHVLEGLRAGAVGYLLKDVSSEKLVEAIEVAARGESFLQPSIAAKVIAELTRTEVPKPAAPEGLEEPLSEREKEILVILAEGATNKEIALKLHLAEGTVKNHITNILGKLQVRDRTQAALRARELGLV